MNGAIGLLCTFVCSVGLAYRAAGRKDDAIAALESVVNFMVSRDHLDFPPRTAVALAELHQENTEMLTVNGIVGQHVVVEEIAAQQHASDSRAGIEQNAESD